MGVQYSVQSMDPLRLFLPPNGIKRFGAELDRMYPGVHLYETALKVGQPAKFIRVLGVKQMAVEFREGPGGHSFRVKGENGEIVAHGEGYTRAHDAKRGYATLVRLIANDVKQHMIDTSSDAAIAIGEEAFRAGHAAALENVMPGRVGEPKTVDQAWSDYTPSEEVRGLELGELEQALGRYLVALGAADA